jgi:hypothetical protein
MVPLGTNHRTVKLEMDLVAENRLQALSDMRGCNTFASIDAEKLIVRFRNCRQLFKPIPQGGVGKLAYVHVSITAISCIL